MLPLVTDSPPDDSALIRAAQAGDRGALEALTRRWWPKIRRWCLVELADRALAEDAAQDTLIRVMRSLEGCDPDRPFGAWLRRLVRNASIDAARKRGIVLPFDRDPAVPARLDRAVDLRNSAVHVLEAFAALTPRQRAALELVDRQGLTPTEAASELGVAPGTVRALLHQGRHTLREHLVAHRPELLALLREAQ